MRSSIGRITLRGAKRLAGTAGPSRAATLAPRSHAFPRDLCSSSAISAENTHKPDDIDPKEAEHVAVVDAVSDQPQPAVEVMTEDISISSVEPAIPSGLEVGTEGDSILSDGAAASNPITSEGAAVRSSPTHSDPAALLETLQGLVGRNAIRSALWNYGNALKVNGQPGLNEQVIKFMLPLLGRNSWSQSAEKTIAIAMDRGYVVGTGLFNCGLHAMAKSGDAEAISRILNTMWTMTIDCNPNASSYNYLIAAHVYRGDVDAAFNVLAEMKKHLIYPTFATYHALITGCLRRRDPRRAYQTLLAVEKQRFDISAMTVAQVMVACANNDDYDIVLHLLSKFEDCLPRYGGELHRIAEFRGLYRLNTPQRTTKKERDIMRGNPRPELGALSAVLHCAFRGGRGDIAARAWCLLREHYPDFEVPQPLWYCLIGAHAGAGEFGKAMDMVATMREKGLNPSMKDLELALIRPLAYDVAAIDEQYYRLCDRADGKEVSRANSALDDVDPASELDNGEGSIMEEDRGEDVAKGVDEVAEQGTEVEQAEISAEASRAESVERSDDRKPSSLADALLKSDEASSWSGNIALDFKPKTVGIDELNCIIAACSTSLDLDRAFQTFDEVESRFKLERNIDTYNSLLEGCVQTRRLSGGLRVLEEIEAVGLPVRGNTIHLGARLLLRGGRSEDVVALLEKAENKGESVQLQTYQMVLKQFTRLENTAHAAKVLKLGESAGFDFRSLTGRFDFDGVKKLHLAAYGKEFPTPLADAAPYNQRGSSTGNQEDLTLETNDESTEGKL